MTAIKIPKDLHDNPHDYISFRVFNKEKKEYDHTACFSILMHKLPEVSIECFPNKKQPYKLDDESYLEWMFLCQQNNLLPQCSTFYVNEQGQHYRYPQKLYDRHLIYTSLCCYRWSQHLIRMVWQILEHCREKPITFYQALHYGIGTYVSAVGHSFSPIVNSMYEMYGVEKGAKLNLANSLIWKSFFAPENQKDRQNAGQTWDTLQKRAQKEIGKLPISKLSDILLEKWTPLYEASFDKPKDWKKLYDKIKGE